MRSSRFASRRAVAVAVLACVSATTACSTGPGSSANPPSHNKRLTAAEYRYGASPHRDPRVTYQPDVVMPGGGAASVRWVSADGMTWTIDGNASGVDQLKPGKIMFVSNQGVGRVLGTRKVGHDVAVTIGPIAITDLIRKADISYQGPLDLSQVIASVGPHVPNTLMPLGTGHNGAYVPPTSTTLAPPSTVSTSRPPTPKVQPATLALPATPSAATGGAATAAPPGTLPPAAPGIPSAPISDFKTYPLNGSNGFGYEIQYNKGGTKVYGRARLYLDSPSIRFDLVVTPRGVQTATVKLTGAAGIQFDFQAGSEAGIAGNIHYMLPLPVDFHIPIFGPAIPLAVTFSQVFSIDSAFSAKNATLKFGGDYAFGGSLGIGYDHGHFGVTPPSGFTVRKSLLQSVQGVSVGINSFVMAYGFRVLVGLGAGGFAFGPYAQLNNAIAVVNGSDLGIVKCKGATFIMDLGYGIGYSMPLPVARIINFFLRALNLHQIHASGGTPPRNVNLIRLPGYYPKVNACQGAA